MLSMPHDADPAAARERTFEPYVPPRMSMDEMKDLESFGDHAAALAARIAAAEAAGESVPVEARMMLAQLRELARAVDGLQQSIAGEPQPPAADGDETR